MSKAFTKDDDAGIAPQFVRSRAPLPRGTPNYVTSRGLAALRDERAQLEAERSRGETFGDLSAGAVATPAMSALTARLAELDARIGSAVVVPAPADDGSRETIRFGATVTVASDEHAERRYQIVGVDEADAALGRIAFTAPLARALLGLHAGEVAEVTTLHSAERWRIRAITYE